MREESLIKKVKFLTEGYSFGQPFSNYLKDFFRRHPEMGSRDRRETRDWSFNLLRIGNNLDDQPFELRLSVACFLCCNNIDPSISYLLKKYSDFSEADMEKPIGEKLEIVKDKFASFSLEKIFVMLQHISPSIRKDEWLLSFLRKPSVWIRLRKNYSEKVIAELNEKGISFTTDSNPLTLTFPPGTSLEKTTAYQNGYFEIQDKSSQATGEFFKPGKDEHWWDACAGSGGKSLLLMEEEPSVKIFATDVREKILAEYNERMKRARHKKYKSLVADLSSGFLPGEKFDGIIADVPCSGSGTWARSPEWITKDLSSEIDEHFIPLQRKIVESAVRSLKSGFPLIYITCSVFSKENEENVRYFLDRLPLKLENSAYIEGYEAGADTLYVARLMRNS